MKSHPVTLKANEGIYKGLSKQNMLFHDCLCELIDNGIAATDNDQKFIVDIVFEKSEQEDIVNLYVVDRGKGMSLEILKKALNLGESATTESRLNEHGFGMKNSLATLSGGNGTWDLWTKPKMSSGPIYKVSGPFSSEMEIFEIDEFPDIDHLPLDISTLIKVPVQLSFVQTAQGRGAKAKELVTLRKIILEHIGVKYRGYLFDEKTYESSGKITVAIGKDRKDARPINVPLASSHTKYIEIELNGKVETLEYRFGTLDRVKRDSLVDGSKTTFYYLGNQPTQGIDIRLGKRVIATSLLDIIWKSDRDPEVQLQRHNNYNDFVGELLIPELPRGVLTTVNNKTDFNLSDKDWISIFEKMNEYRPIKEPRQNSETALRKAWVSILQASVSDPKEQITDEKHVWPGGTRIDVYRKTATEKVIVYEIKVGTGEPKHLYQLKMYWDGLVLENEEPHEAILLVENYSTSLEEMANKMNSLEPPKKGSNEYNFKIMKHSDVNLKV